MSKVNFYLLKQNTDSARAVLACKLAEQQLRQNQRVFLLADSADAAKELDQLLWSFSAESFVPHTLNTDAAGTAASVQIGAAGVPAGFDCVLNLATEALDPASVSSASTIAEFILNDETAKAQSRLRWNHYKQLGCELQLHQL